MDHRFNDEASSLYFCLEMKPIKTRTNRTSAEGIKHLCISRIANDT